MTPQDKILNAKDRPNIQQAAGVLRQGGVVVFPTETVYGLGADCFNEKAVCRVFEAKKRPTFDPLIVHVSSHAEARSLWKETPPLASLLMEAFWPGPLTIVLPKKDTVSDVVTAGLATVAVRMPRHPVAIELIRLAACPVAAPSANLFGYTSPTTAQAAWEDIGQRVDLILDDGPSPLGVESTVVKVEDDHCVLLRPGAVLVEEIERVARVIKNKPGSEDKPESPGQMKSHYAPWTPMILSDKLLKGLLEDLEQYDKLCRQKKIAFPRIGLLTFSEAPESPLLAATEVLSPKSDLYEAASNLFGAMRKLDKMHLDLLVALGLPQTGIGHAIMDRLSKASGGKTGVKHFFENLIQ